MDDLLPGYEEQMFSKRPFTERGVRASQGNDGDGGDDGDDDLFLTYDPYISGDFTQAPLLPVPVLLRQTQATRALQCLKRESTYKDTVSRFMKNKLMPINRLDLLSRQFLFIYFKSVLTDIQQNIDYSNTTPIIVQNVISLDGYKQFKSRYEMNELNPESVLNIDAFTYEQKVYLCVYYFLKMKQLHLSDQEIEASSLLCIEGGSKNGSKNGSKKMKKDRYSKKSKKSKTKGKKMYTVRSRKQRH